MARVTRADLAGQEAGESVPIIEALAPLATGVNDDGTNFYLPTEYKVDAAASANLTAVAQAATISCQPGYGTVSFHVSGVFVGTVQFEVTIDGTNWWPLIGTRSDGTAAAASATASGFWEAALPAGCVSARIRCSAFTSGTIAATVAVSPETYEPGVYVVGGSISVNPLPVGTNTIGNVANVPRQSGGLTAYRNISLGAGALVKGSAGQLYMLQIDNLAASTRFVKVYSGASAPTAGAGTPILTIPVVANGSSRFSAGDIGLAIGAGIGLTCTTSLADTDAVTAGANEVVVNVLFA